MIKPAPAPASTPAGKSIIERLNELAEYAPFLAVIAATAFLLDMTSIVPATIGFRASGVVSSAYVSNPNDGISRSRARRHCTVGVTFQVAPGFAPEANVTVSTRLCDSIKPNDRIPVRYIRLGRETVWTAAVEDGGHRMLGLMFILLGALILKLRTLLDR